jgi:hypothetical protein
VTAGSAELAASVNRKPSESLAWRRTWVRRPVATQPLDHTDLSYSWSTVRATNTADCPTPWTSAEQKTVAIFSFGNYTIPDVRLVVQNCFSKRLARMDAGPSLSRISVNTFWRCPSPHLHPPLLSRSSHRHNLSIELGDITERLLKPLGEPIKALVSHRAFQQGLHGARFDSLLQF